MVQNWSMQEIYNWFQCDQRYRNPRRRPNQSKPPKQTQNECALQIRFTMIKSICRRMRIYSNATAIVMLTSSILCLVTCSAVCAGLTHSNIIKYAMVLNRPQRFPMPKQQTIHATSDHSVFRSKASMSPFNEASRYVQIRILINKDESNHEVQFPTIAIFFRLTSWSLWSRESSRFAALSSSIPYGKHQCHTSE